MKLIVGLGNPGKEYEKTRHNVGFNIIDGYLASQNVTPYFKDKFNGLYFETKINDEKVIFLKPCMFMNLSGQVVKRYVDFYKIDISDVLVISDDLDLSIGRIKIKSKGSCGGHNGLRDIEKCLGTQEYKRIKVGISNNKNIDTCDYVLGKFSKEDLDVLNSTYKIVYDIINDYFLINFDKLMNKYNTKNR